MPRRSRVSAALEVLRRDFGYALRTLRKSPGFTSVAVLSLALGIGANTALFSLVDALMLRALPVAEPGRLVYVQRTAESSGKRLGVDPPALQALRDLETTFSSVATYVPMTQPAVAIDGVAEPDRLVMQATGNLLRVLGVRAEVGSVDPAQAGAPAVDAAVVISERFWTRRFGRSPAVVGRRLSVNDRAYPVVGVAGAGFLGMSPDASVDVWLLVPTPGFAAPSAIARLNAGIARDQARAAAAAMFAELDRQSPPPGADGPIRTELIAAGHGESSLRAEYERPLVALTALVVVVLLATCTNIGTLLVGRNRARLRELAVRASLGARRSRLVSQLLVESVVIAAMGAAAGWLLARWGVSTLVAMLPLSTLPEQLTFQSDVRVLTFMAALSTLAAMLFGFLPAWRASRVDVTATLKSTQATATSPGARRLGLWLVGSQVALSVVLVAGAGLFVQTLRNLATADLGFDPTNLIHVELAARTISIRPEEVPAVHDQLLERVAAVPGVSGVTAFGTPLYPAWATASAQPTDYAAGIVGPDFFELMRIPLVRGRVFTAADAARPEGYSIVTESFAKQTFPGEDAIGKRAGFGNLEVVGIVRDAKLNNVRWDVEPMVYRMGLRQGRLMSTLLVRTAVEPAAVMRSMHDAVSSVNPRLVVSIKTVDDVVNQSIARERLVATTSGFFGVLGLALSGIGLFGAAAFAVVRRTSELGLRMALGATPWHAVRESLGETMRVFVWGLVVGLAAALAAARLTGHFVSGLLFGLQPTDWMNIAAAAALMVLIAVVACLVPALRASRIDPLTAIRME